MGLLGKRSGPCVSTARRSWPSRPMRATTLGLAYVPEERRIVPGLSVRENLRLGLIAGKRPAHRARDRIAEIAQTFPRLAERMHQDGTSLSGGEQQMLAIARAMMSKPRMILLDEPSEGIMPLLVHEMFELFSNA
jgi:branched-chain amino acid transport system ATP-binding protein